MSTTTVRHRLEPVRSSVSSDASQTRLQSSVDAAPATVNDFLELARFWKPAGTLGFHIPLVVGVLASTLIELPTFSLPRFVLFNIQLSLASLFQRSAACAWNDAADYEFDKQVSRTRNRPIPRGSVTPGSAQLWAVALAVIWFAVVWPSGKQAMWTLVPNLLFNIAYPYIKRISHYPQVFLGFTTCWNVLTGYAMTTRYDLTTLLKDNNVQSVLLYLMLAEAAFNGFYDTIYAYQDYADDQKAGVKSVTLKFGENGKLAIGGMAALEVVFLALAGKALDADVGYYICTCFGSAILAVISLWSCNLHKPDDCGLWFKLCIFYGALVQIAGFVVAYTQRVL